MKGFVLKSLVILVMLSFFYINSYAQEVNQTPPPRVAEEVVVTGSMIKQEVEDLTVSYSEITDEEIKTSGAQTISDVLKRIAGLEISYYGDRGSNSNVTLRGSSVNQVLILINGSRSADPSQGLYDLGNIPLSDIEKIEIVKGSGSSLYGSDAIGGVVNIILKKPVAGKEYKIGAFGGSYGLWHLNAQYKQNVKDLGFVVSATQEESSGQRENSYLKSTFGRAGVSSPAGEYGLISFDLTCLNKEIGAPGPNNYPAGLDRLEASSPDNWQKDDEYRGLFKYEIEKIPFMNIPSTFKANLYYDYYKRQYYMAATDPFAFAGAKLSEHKNSFGGLSLVQDMKFNNQMDMAIGLEFNSAKIKSTDLDEHSINYNALFMEFLYKLNPKWSFNISGRYDKHSVFGGEFSPKVGFAYSLSGETKFHCSLAEGFRAPTLSDLYWPNDGFTAGNDKLGPEHSLQFEVGLKRMPKNGTYNASVTIYNNDVKDLIQWAETSPFFWQPDNVARARVRGIELDFNMPFNNKAGQINFNYTFNDTKDKTTGGRILNRPKHMINLGIAYKLPYELVSNLKFRYVDNYNTIADKDEEWDNYSTIDWKLNLDLQEWTDYESNAYIGIDNILDSKYSINQGYPLPGRTFIIGSNIMF